MKDSAKIKTILKSSIFFILMICLTFYLLFKDNNIVGIFNSIKNANPYYIFLAIACMSIFIMCEGINIFRNLKILGYNTSILQGIKYALVGFFFSAITPSASGGQPMQVYFMNKDKIDISHSAIALLVELASFQINTVFIALCAFIIKFDFFTSTIGNIKYLLFFGIALNVIAFIFIFSAIFSKSMMSKAVNFVVKMLDKFNYKNIESFKRKAEEHLNEYRIGAMYMKKNKIALLKTILITFIQLISMYSITFFVYKAFGLSGYSLIEIVSIQAILYSSVAALPLPGGIGASEGGFISLFKFIFPSSLVSSGMMLSRGINFYLFVLIAGVSIMVFQAIYIKKNNEKFLNIN